MTGSMFQFPPEPPEGPSVAGTERSAVRYDDITQDGRIRLEGIWTPTGRLLWNADSPLSAMLFSLMNDHGIRMVLTRVVLDGTDERIRPREPLASRLSYRFEHTVDDRGEVRRLLFNTWVTLESEGRVVARAYGERALVRLGAPPGQRAVTRLPPQAGEPVPPHRGRWTRPEALLALPDGATPIDDNPRLDAGRIVFGLSHTDSNQHVNFLSYPRFAEPVVLGRLVDLGLGAKVLARQAEIGYRQPCHAGEVLRVAVQAFRSDQGYGAVAAFVDADDGPEARPWRDFPRPRCVVRLWLSP